VVGLADLQAEVVQAHMATRRDRRGVRADLDEQQIVMSASRRGIERRGGHPGGTAADLGEAEDVAVEMPRLLEVADVEHRVPKLLYLHRRLRSRVGAQ